MTGTVQTGAASDGGKHSAFAELGCRPIINASGKMTALGASTVSDGVAEALRTGAQSFVDIDELLVASGRVIAQATGAEDGCPTTGAAAGIVLSTAAVLTQGRTGLLEAVPDLHGLVPDQVIIQKGHAVHFGAAITQLVRIGGGAPVEVGHANFVERAHIEDAIGPDTAALLYIKSHHAVQKGMQSLEVMRDIAHEHGLPLLVDAAAEEDFRRYIALGADLVMYSGAKALSGPTSGLVCGRADLVKAVRAQYRGVGRPMKVGKEAILGLCRALQEYEQQESDVLRERAEMEDLAAEVSRLPGITGTVTQDEAGREIFRATIRVDPAAAGLDAVELARRLEAGTPAVYTRNHYANTGRISVDPRPLHEGDARIVAEQIARIVTDAVYSKENPS